MKKITTCLFTLLICTVVNAQSDKDLFLTQSLAKENIQKVMARTSGGSITITGGSGSEARLEVYIRPANNGSMTKEELQKRLDEDYQMVIAVANNELTATARKKNKFTWKDALSISYKIYVPQNVATDLNTSGGSISMTNLSGKQDFATSGGSLRIDKLTGAIHGQTSGGSISVANSKDNINLETSGGSIKAENCSGNIRLNTSGGSIGFTNLQGTINVNTSGGSINGNNVTGDLAAHTSGGGVSLKSFSGSVDASTSGGGMDIDIIKLDKYVTIDNSGGSINLKLPAANQGLNLNLQANRVNIDALTNFSGSKERDNIKGTINGGGVPVRAHSASGTINLGFSK